MSESEAEVPKGTNFKWLRWVIWGARAEFGLAWLVSMGLMAGGAGFFPADLEFFWNIWLALVFPSFLVATILSGFVAYVVKRPFQSLAGEVLFWAVFPGAAFAMLYMSSVQSV